eukprot:2444091-Karenia_brevis.AAC.1
MYGGGVRCSADVAPAAFLGALCRTVPRMLDRVGPRGQSLMGFMPQLENLLGRGSFDDGLEGTRFEMLLRTGVPLATQLRDTWH